MADEYAIIPLTTIGMLERYANNGLSGGSFLDAVMSNDLFTACANADLDNSYALPTIVMYVYNRMPAGCHGSKEIKDAWIAHKGLAGLC